jgi:hypothetical protein
MVDTVDLRAHSSTLQGFSIVARWSGRRSGFCHARAALLQLTVI